MTTDRDDPVRRYREASDALDERPSAAARAAVLAAAARKVGAKPVDADAGHTMRRPRWPLAAAAAVLLSTLAVLTATRTEREMPAFTAPAERATDAVAPPAGPEPGRAEPAPAKAPEDSASSTAAGKPPAARSTPERARAAAPAARSEERAADTPAAAAADSAPRPPSAGAGAQSSDAFPGTRGEAAPAPSPAAPPPPASAAPPAPPPAVAPMMRSAPAAGAMRAPADAMSKQEAAAEERAARESERSAARRAEPESRRAYESSAPAWLERIVRLRAEGRHADADDELARFRARYPSVDIPRAALPPDGASGTR